MCSAVAHMPVVSHYGMQGFLGWSAALNVDLLPRNAVAGEQHWVLVHCQGHFALLVHRKRGTGRTERR